MLYNNLLMHQPLPVPIARDSSATLIVPPRLVNAAGSRQTSELSGRLHTPAFCKKSTLLVGTLPEPEPNHKPFYDLNLSRHV